MRNWGMIVVGGVLILLGLMSALSALFDINPWMICGPSLLILAGVLILLGPRIGFPSEDLRVRPFGGIRRMDTWLVGDEEFWTFVGDVRLDFTQAELPPGTSTMRVLGFVGDVNLVLPEGIEFSLSSTAFLNDTKIFGVKREIFFGTLREQSPGYENADRKINIEMLYFVNDLDIVG